MNVKATDSLKRIALTKANAQIVGASAIAAFIVVFCLIASDHFLGIHSYQSKVVAADTTANNTLQADIAAKNQLVKSYEQFTSKSPNVLGKANTTTPYKYNNATIILDALPAEYDLPAFNLYFQNLLANYTATVNVQPDSSGQLSASPNPQPIQLPVTIDVTGTTYSGLISLFSTLQQSVMPIAVDSVDISGSDTSMSVNISAHIYVQGQKQFKIKTEVVPQ